MKTTFKNLAISAGVAAGFAGMAIPAHAYVVGEVGEAALVPFAVHSPNYLNTVVKITVPKSVGNGYVPNFFTATHSSPTNGSAATPGSENPGAAALDAGWSNVGKTNSSQIKWYWLDENSVHRKDGDVPVTQDDTFVFDWAAVDSNNEWVNRLGYLVFVTESGSQGLAADFSFAADAWLVIGNNPLFNTKVSIPALPMNDGKDGTSNDPTLENSVIEYDTNNLLVVNASPLAAGTQTIWSDGTANNFVFDLPLVNNYNLPFFGAGTIVIAWNDRNASKWNSIPSYRFNNNEKRCSGQISLPDEVNLLFVPNTSKIFTFPSALGDEGEAAWWNNGEPTLDAADQGVDAAGRHKRHPLGVWGNLIKWTPDMGADTAAFAGVTTVCTNPENDGENNYPLPATNGLLPFYNGLTIFNDTQMSGGFLKLTAPEPADNKKNAPEGAAVFLTLPIHVGFPFGWAGWPLFQGDILLGHGIGAFTTTPN